MRVECSVRDRAALSSFRLICFNAVSSRSPLGGTLTRCTTLLGYLSRSTWSSQVHRHRLLRVQRCLNLSPLSSFQPSLFDCPRPIRSRMARRSILALNLSIYSTPRPPLDPKFFPLPFLRQTTLRNLRSHRRRSPLSTHEATRNLFQDCIKHSRSYLASQPYDRKHFDSREQRISDRSTRRVGVKLGGSREMAQGGGHVCVVGTLQDLSSSLRFEPLDRYYNSTHVLSFETSPIRTGQLVDIHDTERCHVPLVSLN